MIYYINPKRVQGNLGKELIRKDLEDNRTNLGDAIFYFRYKIGLSLEKLQRKSGISAPYIDTFEKGLRINMSSKAIEKISIALGVDLNEYVE